MRRLLALFLSITLLTVSSVPMVVEAADCAGPEQATEMMDSEHEGHHHDDGVETSIPEHDHSAAFVADLPKERIECGCGCHRGIDSLPHLLAPYVASSVVPDVDQLAVHIRLLSVLPFYTYVRHDPSPPPQLS